MALLVFISLQNLLAALAGLLALLSLPNTVSSRFPTCLRAAAMLAMLSLPRRHPTCGHACLHASELCGLGDWGLGLAPGCVLDVQWSRSIKSPIHECARRARRPRPWREWTVSIFPGYCRRAVHTRFCTVLLVTVPQFCAPLYGNSVQSVTFADFFCDPFVPRRSKKERLRSVRRSTLTACSAEVNRFGLRFVRAHLTGVFLRSTLTACSAEVNRFGLRFVRVTIADLRRSKTGDTVQI
jgi:hypothetical protein